MSEAPAGQRPPAGITPACTGEPLSLTHQERLAPLLAARWQACDPPEQTLADPWFANLVLFREEHDWRWLSGNWPCVSGHAYDGTRLLIPLFELERAPVDTMRALLDATGATAFGPLSGRQALRLDRAYWLLSQVRDEADYLYRAEQFRHYRGRLQKKGNLVRQLLARHTVQALDYEPALAPQARQVLLGWMHDKDKPAGESDDGPCEQALALADRLGLQGVLYRIEGRPAGFLLAETIASQVMVIRFAKALDEFKGLYQYMFQQFCRARPQLEWLNFEQDLGIENFRRSKLSYRPAALLGKFRAVPQAEAIPGEGLQGGPSRL